MLDEIASGIKEKSPEVCLATIVHVGGEDAIEKYNGFTFDSEEDQRNLEVVIDFFLSRLSVKYKRTSSQI